MKKILSIASGNSGVARGFRRVRWVLSIALGTAVGVVSLPTAGNARGSTGGDQKTVAALDTEYQAAVKRNDAVAMARILADNFVLVTGSGKTYTKDDLLKEARSQDTTYERNDEDVQTVRVWGDTAVVTGRLWEKGRTTAGVSFDRKFWFSDTYVRTPAGWKYVFGQSSLPPSKPVK